MPHTLHQITVKKMTVINLSALNGP